MPGKWSSPYEWLRDKAIENYNKADWLYEEFLVIAALIGSDKLQALYKSEMEEDGYFDNEKEG